MTFGEAIDTISEFTVCLVVAWSCWWEPDAALINPLFMYTPNVFERADDKRFMLPWEEEELCPVLSSYEKAFCRKMLGEL